MHVTKVVIKNYRAIRSATVEFRDGITIVVGNNECGKSTLLEAIHVALTGQLGGRSIRHQLHPYLFNRQASLEYAQRAAQPTGRPKPPEILIEVYLADDDVLVRLKGTNNSLRQDVPGVSFRVRLDETFGEEFVAYLDSNSAQELLPIEFFDVEWLSFAGELMSPRRMPFRSQLVDTSRSDPRRGPGRYISTLVGEHLTRSEQMDLSIAYRSLKLEFEQHAAVSKVNDALAQRRAMSEKTLSVAMDMMTGGDWDQGVVPLLDDIPFELVGRGEQSAATIWLAVNAANRADVVLLEEPETHLAYGMLNALIGRLRAERGARQMIVTTHSSFVLNKLGLGDVLLFDVNANARLTDLDESTAAFFQKLPGHDTLRVVLAKKVILVEGPSDELIVQRAFLDANGRRPIEAGVDVVCVRGLAFKRYLDIAVAVRRDVVVVTDNDGDTDAMLARYADYAQNAHITIRVSDHRNGRTLEPQIVAVNDLSLLAEVLGRTFRDKSHATEWMIANKADAALLIHDSAKPINYLCLLHRDPAIAA